MAEEKKVAAKKPAKKKKELPDVLQELPVPSVTIEEIQTIVEVTEEGTEHVIETVIADKDEEILALEAALPEVMQIEKEIERQLSKQASGWRDWLAYQRMTPEDFIVRYPSHKMRHLIQEIIDFNAKK